MVAPGPSTGDGSVSSGRPPCRDPPRACEGWGAGGSLCTALPCPGATGGTPGSPARATLLGDRVVRAVPRRWHRAVARDRDAGGVDRERARRDGGLEGLLLANARRGDQRGDDGGQGR